MYLTDPRQFLLLIEGPPSFLTQIANYISVKWETKSSILHTQSLLIYVTSLRIT